MSKRHPFNDGTPLPGVVDYINAIHTLGQHTKSDLLRGTVARTNPRFGEPWIFAGSYAIVFIMERPGARPQIVRCWTRSIGAADDHYTTLKSRLQTVQLPWLVDFEFLAEGILVEEQWWPVLRMDFKRGQALHLFLREARARAALLRQLADEFLEMMRGLYAAKIAHGDLQNENILIRLDSRGEMEIRLIDYDTLALPGNYGTESDNEGVPAFQHPSHKAPRKLAPQDDAFGSLVIYLSILALAEDPDLWDDYDLERCDKESLLFTREDFTSAVPTEKFRRLRKLSPVISNLTLILWNYRCCPSGRYLPCLEDVVELANTHQPVLDPAKTADPEEKARRMKDWTPLTMQSLPSSKVRNSAWLEEWDEQPLPSPVRVARRSVAAR